MVFKHVVDLFVLIHRSMCVSPVGDWVSTSDSFFNFFAVMWWKNVEDESAAVYITAVCVAAAVLCQLFSFQRWFHVMETDIRPVTGSLFCKKKNYITYGLMYM